MLEDRIVSTGFAACGQEGRFLGGCVTGRRGLPGQHYSAAAVRVGKVKCDAVCLAAEIEEKEKKKRQC